MDLPLWHVVFQFCRGDGVELLSKATQVCSIVTASFFRALPPKLFDQSLLNHYRADGLVLAC